MKLTTLPVALAAVLPLVSCQKKDESSTSQTESPSSLSERILLDSRPEDASNVADLFADPEAGREVVVNGLVMGRPEVFIPNRAALILGDDETLTPCNAMPDDHCETPWDVCCDDPDVIKKSIATIQFVDDSGKLLKESLKGVGGIQELSELTVTGTIAEGSSADHLVVNASGIYVVEP
ncbi:MAG: hypothetical protein Q7Q71_15610 [Verrucomicrobiota bacterium JB023]|nr:hypothetical protein [Verrucomicrobiota bacterium JB023]